MANGHRHDETRKDGGTSAVKKTDFSVFCWVCLNYSTPFTEPVAHFKSSRARGSDFKRRFDALREQGGWPRVFSVMRLFLPKHDRERKYNMKEDRLREYLLEAMGVDKNSEEGKALKQKVIPERREGDHPMFYNGKFESAAYGLLRDRCAVVTTLTIDDVNDYLDQLSTLASQRGNNRREIVKLFSVFCAELNASDFFRLILIILKQSVIPGMGEKSILGAFHKDACAYFNVCCDLRRLCEVFNDRNVDMKDFEIELFYPFRPMRGVKGDTNFKRTVNALAENHHYIQRKFDGDRYQLHLEGKHYELFSRNGFNQTNHFSDTLGPALLPLFSDHVKSCILDGEMMVYEESTKSLISRTLVGLRSRQVRGDREDESVPSGSEDDGCSDDEEKKETYQRKGLNHHFVVFDIVYLNGEALCSKELKTRLEILNTVFKETSQYLSVAEVSICNAEADIVKAMNEAIERCEEGIVVKNPMSKYDASGKQNRGESVWLKMKPGYYCETAEAFDLVVMGASYGDNVRRRSLLTKFIVGVVDKESKVCYALGSVSGYNDKEITAINNKLKDHIIEYKKGSKSEDMNRMKFGKTADQKPQFYILPEKSIIFQVKAHEILKKETSACGYSLRFSRFDKIREDLTWLDCPNIEDLRKMYEEHSGLVVNHGLYDLNHTSKKQKTTPTRTRQVAHVSASQSLPEGINEIELVSEIFSDLRICVVLGDKKYEKYDILKAIAANGGIVVGTPAFEGEDKAYCIIAGGEEKHVKVTNAIRNGGMDIVRPVWVFDCIKKKQLLPLTPHYCRFLTENTRKENLDKGIVDEDGDMCDIPLDKDSCKMLIDGVRDKFAKDNDYPWYSQQKINHYYDHYKDDLPHDVDLIGVFRGTLIFIDLDGCPLRKNSIAILESQIEINGGILAESRDGCSHVITFVTGEALKSKRNYVSEGRVFSVKNSHLVVPEWVNDCIENKKLLPEDAYDPIHFHRLNKG